MSRRREPQSPYNPLEHLRPQASTGHTPLPDSVRSEPPLPLKRPRTALSESAPLHTTTRPRRLPCVRVGLTPDRKRAFEQLCHRLGGSLDASLPPSQVLRVCCELLLEHQDVLLSEAHALRPLPRPPNDDHAAMRRFEERLRTFVLRVLRVAPCARRPSM